MKKEEFIKCYGEEAYAKKLEQTCVWTKSHQEEKKAHNKEWREDHQEEVIAASHEANRKGGNRYNQKLEYLRTGLQGNRNRVRTNHSRHYKPYKDIIAPDSQLHHQWCPQSASYTGLALVEADQHMHGSIDVIKILEGAITVFTEEEIRAIGEDL